MPTIYTIPNRPVGTDPRAIAPIIADFDAILAALNSFDGGNIQAGTIAKGALATSALQAFLQLKSNATRNIQFGSFASGGFGGGQQLTGGPVAHGLGVVPAAILLTSGAIAVFSDPAGATVSTVTASYDGTVDATNFSWRLRIDGGGFSNNGVVVYWAAIG